MPWQHDPPVHPPTAWKQLLAATAAGAAALAFYVTIVEPRWIERTHTRVGIAGLPESLAGLRVALLTDLHADRFTSLRLLRQACRLAMDAHPDVIAITGDLITDGGRRLPKVVDLLGSILEAPLGVYVVRGNHDHDADPRRWTRSLSRQAHVHDLTNRVVDLRREGARVRLAGVDDLGRGRPEPSVAERGRTAADLTLLLSHNPDVTEEACEHLGRVDLVLSGHTHGGQVRLPGVGALLSPSQYGELYTAGLQRRPWTQVYTSRGIGTVHLPVRLLARPEVAILELVPA